MASRRQGRACTRNVNYGEQARTSVMVADSSEKEESERVERCAPAML